MCECCKELEKTIERLQNTRVAMNAQVLRWEKLYDYQRRHRKWALKAAHNSFYLRCMWLSWFVSEKTHSRQVEAKVKELEEELGR